MINEQANEVSEQATDLGNAILKYLYAASTPDVGISALASVVAVVFCNVTLVEGVTMEQAQDDWFKMMKEDYKDFYDKMHAEQTKQ